MLELSAALADSHDLLVGIGPLVVGIAVVALLIAAFAFGRWQRAREPRAPRNPAGRSGAWETPQEREDDTWPESHGPGHQEDRRTEIIEEHEQHAPQVMPRDGIRRTPHHLLDPDTSELRDREPEQQDRRASDHGEGPRTTG